MRQRSIRPTSRRVPIARASLAVVAAAAVAAASSCATTPSTATGSARAIDADWLGATDAIAYDQLVHSTMSCGPAAVLTALVSEGDAATGSLRARGALAIGPAVERYGTRPSATRDGVPRFKPASGVNPIDLLDWTNEWRADLGLDARAGTFLDRTPDESDREFCVRVHRALADALAGGAVPIVRVRSFAPTWYPGRSSYLWDGVSSHWIAVVGVPAQLDANGLGFALHYADPAGGDLETGWVQVETEREFVAAKGDAENWSWAEGRSFLVVHAPGLRSLGRAGTPWFLRTVVTLDCAILPPATLDTWPVLSPLAGDEPPTGSDGPQDWVPDDAERP